jgi:hypothetical protein
VTALRQAGGQSANNGFGSAALQRLDEQRDPHASNSGGTGTTFKHKAQRFTRLRKSLENACHSTLCMIGTDLEEG